MYSNNAVLVRNLLSVLLQVNATGFTGQGLVALTCFRPAIRWLGAEGHECLRLQLLFMLAGNYIKKRPPLCFGVATLGAPVTRSLIAHSWSIR